MINIPFDEQEYAKLKQLCKMQSTETTPVTAMVILENLAEANNLTLSLRTRRQPIADVLTNDAERRAAAAVNRTNQ